MSIYSGFPTREDETNYNRLLVRLITTMQEHIMDLSQGNITANFGNKYNRIINKMQNYEEHKYLPPKFTALLKPLQQSIAHSMETKVMQGRSWVGKNSKNETFFKLQSVREQQQFPSARRHLKKNNTDSRMRQTCGNLKKNKKKTEGSLAEIGSRNPRDYSVYGENKPNSFVVDRKIGKLNCRKTMVYFSENKYNQPNLLTQHRHHNNHSFELEKVKNREENKTLMKAFIDAVHNKK